MSYSNTPSPKQQRHWWRLKPSEMTVVVFVTVLGIVMLTVWHYRNHLLWRYTAHRLGLHDVQATPDHPMPTTPTPDGWVRCHVGCLEFSLPPEMADNQTALGNYHVGFQHGTGQVIVALFTDAKLSESPTNVAAKLAPGSRQFTMPTLRLACYRASSDDFRWSMTPAEVRWHAFCITMSTLMRSGPGGHTESFFRRDLDGMVHFVDDGWAQYFWESKDFEYQGYMNFRDNGEKIDPSWVRAVCQSVKVSIEAETEYREKGKP